MSATLTSRIEEARTVLVAAERTERAAFRVPCAAFENHQRSPTERTAWISARHARIPADRAAHQASERLCRLD